MSELEKLKFFRGLLKTPRPQRTISRPRVVRVYVSFSVMCVGRNLPVLEVTQKITSKCQANKYFLFIHVFIKCIHLLTFYGTHLSIINSQKFLIQVWYYLDSLCYVYFFKWVGDTFYGEYK